MVRIRKAFDLGLEDKPKFPFVGGRAIKVVFDVAKEGSVNGEQELAAAMARAYEGMRAGAA